MEVTTKVDAVTDFCYFVAKCGHTLLIRGRMITMSSPIIVFYQTSPQHLYGGQLDMLRFFTAYPKDRFLPIVLTPAEGVFTEQVQSLGLPIRVMPLPAELAQTGGALLHGSAWDRIRQLALLTPWSIKLARWLHQIGANALYANNRRAVLTLGMAAHLARKPIFWHIKQDSNRGRLDALAMRLMTYAGGCSRDVQQVFQHRHPAHAQRIGYVPNGIPLEQFSASGPDLRKHLDIPSNATVIGLAGSITPRKGVDLFVKAALRLADRFPQAYFLLAGDAPAAYASYKKQILTAARPLLANGRFRASGWQAHMPIFYRTIDILAMPSRVEGFGLTVVEAAAAGIPAVRSATGGHTETTIDGKTGFIVPIDDANALTDRLAWLLAHPRQRQRMGQAARDHVFRHFSLQRFVESLTDALMKTIELHQ